MIFVIYDFKIQISNFLSHFVRTIITKIYVYEFHWKVNAIRFSWAR